MNHFLLGVDCGKVARVIMFTNYLFTHMQLHVPMEREWFHFNCMHFHVSTSTYKSRLQKKPCALDTHVDVG